MHDHPIPLYELSAFGPAGQPVVLQTFPSLALPSSAARPHRHGFYSLSLLLSGRMEHRIDFKIYTLTAPALLVIYPGQVHQPLAATPEATGWLVSFSPSALLPGDSQEAETLVSFAAYGLQTVPAVAAGSQAQLAGLLHLLAHELGPPAQASPGIVHHLLNAFVLYCRQLLQQALHQLQPAATSRPYQLTAAFRRLVEDHYLRERQVGFYAAQLCVTPGHLTDTIKATTGRSVKQMLLARRLLEAQRLLAHSTLTVQEIAWRLHFEDNAYFTRAFRRQVGQTPSVFRADQQQAAPVPLGE